MPGGFKGKEKHSTLSVRSKKCLLPHIKTNNKNKCQLFDVCGYFYSSEYLQLFKVKKIRKLVQICCQFIKRQKVEMRKIFTCRNL